MPPRTNSILDFNRRSFIKYSSLVGVLGNLSIWASSQNGPTSYFLSASFPSGQEELNRPARINHKTKKIAIYNNRTQVIEYITFPIYVHSFAFLNHNSKVIGIPKHGKIAVQYDLINRKMTSFTASTGNMFYGHGVLINNGSEFWCCEAEDNSNNPKDSFRYKGQIVRRETQNFKIIGSFPSFGDDPHDLHVINNGNTLACVNGGRQSNLALINISDNSLIKAYRATENDLVFRHIAFNKNNDFIIAPKTRSGRETRSVPFPLVGNLNDTNNTLRISKDKLTTRDLYFQTLSVAVSDKHFATTCQKLEKVYIWSINKVKLLKIYKLKGARGVCLSPNGKYYVVSSFSGMELKYINISNLQLENIHSPGSQWLAGSHLQLLRV